MNSKKILNLVKSFLVVMLLCIMMIGTYTQTVLAGGYTTGTKYLSSTYDVYYTSPITAGSSDTEAKFSCESSVLVSSVSVCYANILANTSEGLEVLAVGTLHSPGDFVAANVTEHRGLMTRTKFFGNSITISYKYSLS